jgi:Pyruvate/2-oxoacid:ferredoxin oxidoreductase delta subunit
MQSYIKKNISSANVSCKGTVEKAFFSTITAYFGRFQKADKLSQKTAEYWQKKRQPHVCQITFVNVCIICCPERAINSREAASTSKVNHYIK